MKLKRHFILLFIWIHLLLIGFATVFFKSNTVLFIVLEVVVILSMIVTFYFYKLLFRPFRLLQAGIESIADQDFSIKFKKVGQKDMDRLIGVYNKMMDQLRSERTKLSEKHFFLEKLIDASPAAIIILNVQGEIQSLNNQAKWLFQQKSMGAKTLDDLPPPWNHDLKILEENSSGIVKLNGINQYKCYKSYFFDRGVKRFFFIIEELTSEIIKAEKQAYEKVIRMMSHEVNNTVGAINSILDSTLVILDKTDNGMSADFVSALETARERNMNLNRFTSNFAEVIRIPDPLMEDINVTEWIHKMKMLTEHSLKEKGIELRIHTNGILNIKADSRQMEQVIVNVIKNAADACSKGRWVQFCTEDDPESLIIENNGEPISTELQKKLFKPFYTTKQNGQGIGLTLSREILHNHGFDFSLKTRDDGITEFRIVFTDKRSN